MDRRKNGSYTSIALKTIICTTRNEQIGSHYTNKSKNGSKSQQANCKPPLPSPNALKTSTNKWCRTSSTELDIHKLKLHYTSFKSRLQNIKERTKAKIPSFEENRSAGPFRLNSNLHILRSTNLSRNSTTTSIHNQQQ